MPRRLPVLIVDDDEGVRSLLSALLERQNLSLDFAGDGNQAMQKLRRSDYAAIVLDLMLPLANGFEIIAFLKSTRPALLRRVIVLTAASEATLSHFDRTLVRRLIRKPFDIGDLTAAVLECCQDGHHDH